MSVLNIGTRALQANQIALQTAGNNIANVNTPGYSRQSVVLTAVEGQFTGGGYIGKGVDVQTIQRNFSAFLTRQATLASATQNADVARSNKLNQLQDIFSGGSTGLGAAVSDMMNAFSDVASAPTDLTARTVALTRVDETAGRFRAAAQAIKDLQTGVSQEISQKVNNINTLAKNIADVNDEIARAQGKGQPPNDLLDRRDQLVRELNQFVQTTSIAADDGSVGIFLAGSQPLVLGTTVSPVSLVSDDFGDTLKSKLSIIRDGRQVLLDENALGGGEVSGLLRFQNNDLVEGRNLLGRLTLAITTQMNEQHALGLDLDGKAGGDLFTRIDINTTANISKPTAPATLNTGTAALSLSIKDSTQFAASDYEVNFNSATSGNITRKSDGKVITFPQTPPATAPALASVDGLNINLASGAANVGDRFLIKPFATSADNVARVFSTPRQLAVASPIAGAMGTVNKGSLQLVSLNALTNNQSATPHSPVTLTFAVNVTTNAVTYTRSDEVPVANTTSYPFDPNTPITAVDPLANWSLKLTGTPKTGDTFKVVDIKDPAFKLDLKLNGGNATAMMNLRDKAMFDGSVMTDGYASAISQIGIRTQSAGYSATVSSTIAANLEQDRSAVSGVNLDEEAAKLIQYQQAYQASAKMIQIAQNIFDTLIQGLGR
ncbi:flagellar hook-associated protein FlgK [Rhodoferax sp. TBRC 17198]|uniref:flagellar hook-associated protein FlgK n=1 Tax=Rhodoferax potami TaxID=3068338 RepID=UPI0028BE3B20|nr:flagellar hook-associated protein FlgK [Rhodoferax sp. TBRC 17198]MDT7524325.1 flagellar hook-associated protein FlgK [Rhodoferax sp. TBRC 17198]